ncbi:MAG: relaxase/mobilization nuclease domain-containing protein [Bacteroidota bacterium]|nr:relaxase/mobilization nuclease domain-containing protein [Bacteroidota bacterium]
MIVKFLEPSATFAGIGYNFDKIAAGDAELMVVVNFRALESIENPRPEDYKNYLEMFSAPNRRVLNRQLHVVISAHEETFNKHQLTGIGKKWIENMGYSNVPYLVVFHKDTSHNHIHIVSTRIGRDGRKINSGFEHIRAMRAINKIIGIDEVAKVKQDLEKALAYRFQTAAQFKNILESMGYKFENYAVIKFGRKLAEVPPGQLIFNKPGEQRREQLKAIFQKYVQVYDQQQLMDYLHSKMGIQFIFHTAEGKPGFYGYTVIDHARKNAFKGSELMKLKDLEAAGKKTGQYAIHSTPTKQVADSYTAMFPDPKLQINLAGDIDDEAIHGPRRRRKQKARSNQR